MDLKERRDETDPSRKTYLLIYLLTYNNSRVSAVVYEPRDAVLYTKVDAQCDKLETVVGRTKLTTLATIGWLVGWSLTSLFSTNTAISETIATIDLPWPKSRKSAKFRVWGKVSKEVPLFL